MYIIFLLKATSGTILKSEPWTKDKTRINQNQFFILKQKYLMAQA
jgi:hypothetical protein